MSIIHQQPMVAGTTTTEGTVAYQITGSFGEFLAWSTIPNGRKVRYVARDGAQFEEGYGILSAGGVLSRDTILRTSNNDVTKIDWGTGTRTVYPVADLDQFEFNDEIGAILRDGARFRNFGNTFALFASDAGRLVLADATEGLDPWVNILEVRLDTTPRALSVLSSLRADNGLFIGGAQSQAPAISPFASTGEATTGTAADRVMSPLRTAEAIATRALHPVVVGASPSAAGTKGAVPAPPQGERLKYLSNFGDFVRPAARWTEAWRESWAVSTEYTTTHNAGGLFDLVLLQAQAKAANNGYLQDEVISLHSGFINDSGTRRNFLLAQTTAGWRYKIVAAGLRYMNGADETSILLTSTDWRIRTVGIVINPDNFA